MGSRIRASGGITGGDVMTSTLNSIMRSSIVVVAVPRDRVIGTPGRSGIVQLSLLATLFALLLTTAASTRRGSRTGHLVVTFGKVITRSTRTQRHRRGIG